MKNKDIVIGIVIGLACSCVGLVVVLLIFGKGNSINDSLDIAINQGVFTKLMSMGAIPNLAAFFLFIKKNQDAKAQGVLIATVMVAVTTLIIRFI
ncbi:membrane protein [Psychroserpens damuponensis]|uniref:membrane protein n=1 Tax=Psychroserpens damuponensis TaxID=943936 RepID=UPI00058C4700|nr:membrane protein [Psychroserpens damuponensis]